MQVIYLRFASDVADCPHMDAESDIKLAPPGAGLPKPELFIARMLFAIGKASSDRAAITAKFQSERERIRQLSGSLDETAAAKRVLIARLRGLEDSSRNWSVWMTLDHLRIVHGGISRTIALLARDKMPPGAASTAAVKPSPDVTGAVVAEYEASCDQLQTTIEGVSDLRTRLKYAHPWFGPLDAAGWHVLASRHIGIHRRQIENIIKRVAAST